jgi:hypothetical protein
VVRIRRGLPVWKEIKTTDYIVGGSLLRVSVLDCSSEEQLVYLREPRQLQRQIECDRCPNQHSSRSLVCTGCFPGVSSPFGDNQVYNLVTGELCGHLEILDILSQKGGVSLANIRIKKKAFHSK